MCKSYIHSLLPLDSNFQMGMLNSMLPASYYTIEYVIHAIYHVRESDGMWVYVAILLVAILIFIRATVCNGIVGIASVAGMMS